MEASGPSPTQQPQYGTQQPQYATTQAPVFAGQELAGWGPRVGAAIIDGLVVGIPASIIASAVGNRLLGAVVGLVLGIAYWGYLYSREGERNGQSLGKQALEIRVRRDDGQPMSFGPAVVRETLVKGILVGISAILLLIPPILNYLWPLWDDENRAVHDMLVKTHVVKA